MTEVRDEDDLAQLAADAAALLTFQGELGLSGLALPDDWLSPGSSAARRAQASSVEIGGASAERAPPAARAPAPAGPPPAGDPLAGVALPDEPRAALARIREVLGECTRCKLCKLGRTNIVFGVGSPSARLMFVGEGPGRDEDLLGEPFVGEAGKLLDRMILAMGLKRAEVYIANVVKCRPPRNRDPEPDEIEACEPFLRAQLRIIRPEVIVALGRHASQSLLRDKTPISKLRGRWCTYEGTPLMPTYHPAYLLRSPAEKKPVWEDLQQVMGRLGLAP